MTNVFAVVVGYRNPDLTMKAARSLASPNQQGVNVVLWDNYHDGLDRFALENGLAKNPINARVVLNHYNLLWTGAINEAVERYLADEDYILFMNNDCYMPKDAVQKLVETFLLRGSRVGAVGPLVTSLGGPQDPLAAAPYGIRPFRTSFLLGACVMVSRAAWEEIGPLDGSMVLGADDHDYCIRLKHAGYMIFVDPRVTVQHRGHASAGPEWDYWGPKSWESFNKKWAGYYFSQEEGIKCHWGGAYVPGWEKGSGWSEEQYEERIQ